jgi:hypothetical protein
MYHRQQDIAQTHRLLHTVYSRSIVQDNKNDIFPRQICFDTFLSRVDKILRRYVGQESRIDKVGCLLLPGSNMAGTMVSLRIMPCRLFQSNSWHDRESGRRAGCSKGRDSDRLSADGWSVEGTSRNSSMKHIVINIQERRTHYGLIHAQIWCLIELALYSRP